MKLIIVLIDSFSGILSFFIFKAKKILRLVPKSCTAMKTGVVSVMPAMFP